MYAPAVLCWEQTAVHGCSRHSIMNYKKRGFPCVWNGIVHSLCHISACLTRQNKSFSIFQCAGTDGVRRHGRTAVLPPPVSSSPIWCPVLVPSPSSEVLSSPLRLHRPEKRRLKKKKKNPLSDPGISTSDQFWHNEADENWLATVPLPHLSLLHLSPYHRLH